MGKRTWRILLVVGVILLAGIIVTVLMRSPSVYSGDGAFYNGVPIDYETEHTETLPLDGFEKISVDVGDADAELIPGDRFELEYHYFGEAYTLRHELAGGELRVWDERISSKKWGLGAVRGLVYRNVSLQKNTIVIRYPAGSAFSAVSMKGGNGDFDVTGAFADALSLENDYGSIRLDNSADGGFSGETVQITMDNGEAELIGVRARQLSVKNDYGSASFTDCAASGQFILEMDNGQADILRFEAGEASIRNDYGSVRLKECASGALGVEMDNGDLIMNDVRGGIMTVVNGYGNVTGADLVADGLTLSASNGDIDLEGGFAGVSDIVNDYGSVRLSLPGKRADYGLSLNSGYGTIRLDGELLKDAEGDEMDSVAENEGAGNSIRVECENGDISLNFTYEG